MKNPIKKHKQQKERIDEIFGKIAKFFSSSSKPSSVSPEELRRQQYLMNIEKYKINMMDPSTCDSGTKGIEKVELDKYGKVKKSKSKSKKEPKRGRVSLTPNGEVMIDDDKIIKDYSELYIENTSNEVGMGSFRKINVRDFVCYDLSKDLYGIAWLMDPSTSYIAEKISGKLLANKYNQSVNFAGNWQTGKFYGRKVGSRLILPGEEPSKDEIQKKLNSLQNLIKDVKTNFEQNFKGKEGREIISKINSSDNKKLKDFIPEFLKIQKYLNNSIALIQGMGNSSYIKSDELYKIKSMIDNKMDPDDILTEINDLMKYFKIIQSKMNGFYTEYKKLPISPVSSEEPEIKGKGFKKPKF